MKKRFRKLLSILCTLAILVCAFAALADEQAAEVTDQPEVTEGEAATPAEGGEPAALEAEVEDLDELPVVTEETEETEEEAETPEKPAEVPAEEEPEEAAGEPELTEGNAEELVSESVALQEAVEEQAGETPVEAEPAGVEPAADQPEPADEPADAPETEEPAAPVEPTAPAEEPAAPAEDPEAAEPAAENDPPAEEVSQPEEPAAPAENEPESKPEEQQPAETPAETPEGEPQEELIQPEEEQPEEPAEDPEEPEEEPEEEPAEEQEEILLNLNGQTSVSGELTIDTPFTFTASDDYFRTVVFTLTVPEEDSVSVALNDSPVSLTKIENDDPAAAEVQYTFERTLAQEKTYTFTLTTEQEGPVPFTVEISEKTEEEPVSETAEEPAEKLAEEPEKSEMDLEDEEEIEVEHEAILLNLNDQRSVSGELTIDKPFTFTVTDNYSRMVLITLTIPEDSNVFITLNEEPVALTETENPNPTSKNVIYTLTKQINQDTVYSFCLTTDKEGIVPFSVNISENTETQQADNQEEQSEVNTDQKDENNIIENSEDIDRSISFVVFWDVDEPTIGDTAHFKAVLYGYEDLNYTLQWQQSTDNENWVDIVGETNEQMDLLVTEENSELFWRVTVFYHE